MPPEYPLCRIDEEELRYHAAALLERIIANRRAMKIDGGRAGAS